MPSKKRRGKCIERRRWQVGIRRTPMRKVRHAISHVLPRKKLTQERSEQEKLKGLLDALAEPLLRLDFRVAHLHEHLSRKLLRVLD